MGFWNRWPYTNFHEINLDWILDKVKQVYAAMSDYAAAWTRKLDEETQARIDADEALNDRVDQEIKDRTEADEAEAAARQEADEQLQDNIDKEQQRAEAAEKALDDKITAETERATAKENDLQQQITAEVNRATAKENELDQKITAETSRATAREDELEGMIQTETERATAKETELGQQITTETQRATAAEEALGDRIDGIEGELDGITGADSPFIRKDGTTTTTGKIPLAQGGTSEVDPAAATDLVNLRSMQAADQALENSMTEYVDNQLEAVTGEIHSIPAGGTAGQVLGKVDGTDYNVHWVDQTGGGTPGPEGPQGPKGDPGPGVAAGGTAGQVLSKVDSTDYNTQWVDPPSGSDPDAIKKDGTTTTTARIPFAEGVGINSDNYWTERDFVSLTFGDTGGYSKIQNSNGNGASLFATGPDGGAIRNAVRVNPDSLHIMTNGETGAAGQVLTAKGNGTCRWEDAAGGGGNVAFSEHNDELNNYLACVQLKAPNSAILMITARNEIPASINRIDGKFSSLDGGIYPALSYRVPVVNTENVQSVVTIKFQSDGTFTMIKAGAVTVPKGQVLLTIYSV